MLDELVLFVLTLGHGLHVACRLIGMADAWAEPGEDDGADADVDWDDPHRPEIGGEA